MCELHPENRKEDLHYRPCLAWEHVSYALGVSVGLAAVLSGKARAFCLCIIMSNAYKILCTLHTRTPIVSQRGFAVTNDIYRRSKWTREEGGDRRAV